MVASIRFWLKAVGLLQDNELNPIADYLFNDENGQDPYIEDIGTLWLLHFMLVNTQYATIYKTTFVDYHRQRNIIEKADCRTILSILVLRERLIITFTTIIL